ncbi:MAG TPA: hypothetical protein QF753_10615 [Victivallales bacterium]|nr:hypothetical protein [Victivallales bacterium]
MKMKKIVIVLITGLISVGAYAATAQTPKVASVDSVYEGILQLDTQLGQQVKKGQLIFHMQTNLLKLAALKAKSTLELAESTYGRDKRLAKTHIVSPEALETAKDAYIQAYADYQTALINIKNCYYYAPFNGTVTKIDNYTGSCVGDGNEVMQVTQTLNG